MSLLEHPCVDCGEADVRTLEVDHQEPHLKTDDLTRLLARSLSWERTLGEIHKCQVRCASCHRRRTAEVGGFWRQRVEQERRGRLRDAVTLGSSRLLARG